MDLLLKWKRKKMIEIKNLTTVIITLILSILLAFVSFTGGASEAYLFPKIITSTMIILSSLSLLFYFFEKNQKIAKIDMIKLSVYLILIILFILFGEILGFYFSATLIFLTVCYYYSENKTAKVIVYNLLVTVVFMLFIYFLFSVLLKVQVPRFFLL